MYEKIREMKSFEIQGD